MYGLQGMPGGLQTGVLPQLPQVDTDYRGGLWYLKEVIGGEIMSINKGLLKEIAEY